MLDTETHATVAWFKRDNCRCVEPQSKKSLGWNRLWGKEKNECGTPVEAPLSKGSWIAEGKTEGIDTENVTFRNSVGRESLWRSIPSTAVAVPLPLLRGGLIFVHDPKS